MQADETVCGLARRYAVAYSLLFTRSTSAPGATGRRFCASSCSCRDHTYAGSGIDQHAATGVFTARPSLQDLVERVGQAMVAGQFGELFAHIELSRCGQRSFRANRDIGALAVWSTGDPSSSLRRAKVI